MTHPDDTVRIACVLHRHPSRAGQWLASVICEEGPCRLLPEAPLDAVREAALAQAREMARQVRGRPVAVWTIEKSATPKLDQASVDELFASLNGREPDARRPRRSREGCLRHDMKRY
ncbi:hypothetical protein [Amycolatopsis sp. CA-230715]|uniref:hypothetical protein n=1 Tax=Amycolatopsis sp. CA-230715 TaxID=2745196 RepID=UPI001C03553E|nr:hypothetical protein [Amycolatopsis sp. CA-230715]QWF85734.1 hypothetical protein HUW46_09214 [Amycolatopsis sp. CA-230715]